MSRCVRERQERPRKSQPGLRTLSFSPIAATSCRAASASACLAARSSSLTSNTVVSGLTCTVCVFANMSRSVSGKLPAAPSASSTSAGAAAASGSGDPAEDLRVDRRFLEGVKPDHRRIAAAPGFLVQWRAGEQLDKAAVGQILGGGEIGGDFLGLVKPTSTDHQCTQVTSQRR